MDGFQAEGDLTFDNVCGLYAEAYRLSAGRAAAAARAGSSAGAGAAAEVVYTAREPSRGNRRSKGLTSAPATAKKGPWSRQQGGRRYYSPGGKKGPPVTDTRKDVRSDKRKYDSSSSDQDSSREEAKSLQAEIKKLKARLARALPVQCRTISARNQVAWSAAGSEGVRQ